MLLTMLTLCFYTLFLAEVKDGAVRIGAFGANSTLLNSYETQVDRSVRSDLQLVAVV